MNSKSQFLAPHIYYIWVPWYRGIAVCNAATGTTTVHRYQLDIREVSAKNLLGARPPPSSRMREYTGRLMSGCFTPFGDREVFGMASYDGIQLWFFNPDFVPDIPGAEPFLAVEESG